MVSKSDVSREYEKELERYRSQEVIVNALMAVKDSVDKIDPETVQLINVIYLTDDLTMNREDVDSMFGTKTTSKSLEPLQKAKLIKHLTKEIAAQCHEVNNFARQIRQEENFNVFHEEILTNRIEMLLTQYNEKLVQLVNSKEKLFDVESQAVQYKSGSQQRKQLEMFRLEVKSKIVEIERFKRIILHRICNQTAGNTEALLKLKEFVEELL